MFDIATLQLGLPGGPELLIVLVVLVLLFGANKIPKLARSTGQAMGEFKRGREEIEEELQEMTGDSSESTTGTAETSGSATESASETSGSATESASETSESTTETSQEETEKSQ